MRGLRGVLAGAFYGESEIPTFWRETLAWSDRLVLKPAQILARSKRKRLKCPEMLARVDVVRKRICRQGGHFR